MSVAWVGVGASVLGAVMSADAAGNAADSQAAGAAASDATQRYFYDTTRADNAPFLKNGTAANNRLSYLLGLGGGSAGGGAGSPGASFGSAPSRESFTTMRDGWHPGDDGSGGGQSAYGYRFKEFDQPGYDSAMRAYTESQAAQATASSDPAYGSLNRRFAQSDLANDVPYQTGMQFGLDQGTQGINNQASATGSMLSGATLKALTRFGNDYGNQKAGDAYNRYNTDNTNTYNRLAGIAGSGQTASGQVGSAGMNAGNNISQSQIGMGNARGASQIAQGNAWQNGINGGVSAFKNSGYGSSSQPGWGGGGGWTGGGRVVPDFTGAEY